MSIRDPRVLDIDPLTGVVELFHYDPDTDGFSVEYQQDVEPLLEQNKALYNSVGDYRRFAGEKWRRIASLPPVIVMQLAQRGILSAGGDILDDRRYRKWLDDPENLFFRTSPGKVSR